MLRDDNRTLADPAEAAVSARIAALEQLLGDPHDPDNPFGNAAVLAADERGELVPQAEQALTGFGLNAEFVPRALGGRLDRADNLARVLRPVFRRDPALGLGYGVTSFLAAVAVWAAGSEPQQRWTADLLLGGGRLAIAYHELAHGNDFVRNEFAALPDGADFLLDGRKEVINNSERAEALVLFSRTANEAGPRSHSVLLVDKAALPADRFEHLPRYRTTGVRGCEIGGFAFRRCPLPGDALVGRRGEAVEIALRSFQITRSVVPGMVLGGADTALRTVVGFARQRELYGRTLLGIPHVRSTIVGAFADLLVCDCLCLAATRAVHLLPGQTSVYAAAVKYLVPKLLQEAGYDLSIVLGASFYVRNGDYGVFQKHVRDLPVTSLGHAGSAACQATIIPQLPRLARRSWTLGEAAPPALFRAHEDLPPLDTDRLALAADQDALVASLLSGADRLEGPEGSGSELTAVRAMVRTLVDELHRCRGEVLELSPQDHTALASPHAYAVADRYTLVLAGSACLNVWLEQQAQPSGFLADPRWLTSALARVVRRLGRALPEGAGQEVDWMLEEVLRRHRSARSYDLYDTPLAGRQGET
ncbi:acyl-CoA dehydrogenase [Streptacidiphilus sp. PB12-B1b]|uniref:acyl-CoA dehydrogenase family protein n=1 Tax=Streptacidiphilus sp. PB12-B1b TaxID=2705012 RepID=UPI0015F7F415|nr:acyl-CoA dehydrogenase family protein [Streptacidiphilus sp. PB12-B1b]QMU78143.1 acyl-CoA dehydrogenase [Streptacidiphilus sp. PB12-B1b]